MDILARLAKRCFGRPRFTAASHCRSPASRYLAPKLRRDAQGCGWHQKIRSPGLHQQTPGQVPIKDFQSQFSVSASAFFPQFALPLYCSILLSQWSPRVPSGPPRTAAVTATPRSPWPKRPRGPPAWRGWWRLWSRGQRRCSERQQSCRARRRLVETAVVVKTNGTGPILG